MTCDQTVNQVIEYDPMYALIDILPGLLEVDLSFLKTYELHSGYGRRFIFTNHGLAKIKWAGSTSLSLNGIVGCNPAELFLDSSKLYIHAYTTRTVLAAFESHEHNDHYMMKHCIHLQRMSIKNVSWALTGDGALVHPVTQAMLIKMVQNHPTLRWLRSDLTEENVAMLRQERSDITFVSESEL